MYELISSLIAAGDNELLIAISGAATLIFSVTFIDMIYRLIRSICKKGEF